MTVSSQTLPPVTSQRLPNIQRADNSCSRPFGILATMTTCIPLSHLSDYHPHALSRPSDYLHSKGGQRALSSIRRHALVIISTCIPASITYTCPAAFQRLPAPRVRPMPPPLYAKSHPSSRLHRTPTLYPSDHLHPPTAPLLPTSYLNDCFAIGPSPENVTHSPSPPIPHRDPATFYTCIPYFVPTIVGTLINPRLRLVCYSRQAVRLDHSMSSSTNFPHPGAFHVHLAPC